MKKLGMFLMLLLAMTIGSQHVFAQSVTITLMPGWNWISVPLMDTLDFEMALGSFTPMQGDIIKSQWSNAIYMGNGQWRGPISQFYPGYGYMYKSNRTMPITVTFNAQQPASQVIVTTTEPTDITTHSATCGGSVVSNDGTTILMKGVCWATHSQPTTSDAYSENGSDPGSFTTEITGLISNTVYYVRAYAVSVKGINYGGEVSFTTLNIGGGDDHEYIDLGLPSGLLWATCNVGANTPEQCGIYVAWGETSPKNYYDWSTYQHCMGSSVQDPQLTKYCNDPEWGYNGFIDNLITLLPEDDAATVNWGANWRIATYDEWQELYNNTTSIITTQNGVNGMLFTASNGNSIFLPAAGWYFRGDLYNVGSYGNYWMSTLVISNPRGGCNFDFDMNGHYIGNFGRHCGFPVRAVHSTSQNCIINVNANPTVGGSVNGGGSYQQGANCTLTATANEGYIFINWSENGEVISTNTTYSFTVNGNRNLVANFAVSGGGSTHAFVDLGLPSGTLWATCNVGANSPEDYGDYFSWGETSPKDWYDWNTYNYSQYYHGYYDWLTKYCSDAYYGYYGFTDNLTLLQSGDDAATVNWGGGWHTPTHEEWQELEDNTTQTWTTINGVDGLLCTAANGFSIFLPATGYSIENYVNDAGIYGRYWSSSLCVGGPLNAWAFYFISGGYHDNNYTTYRDTGKPVRPVLSAR
jgi:hypothetical protein